MGCFLSPYCDAGRHYRPKSLAIFTIVHESCKRCCRQPTVGGLPSDTKIFPTSGVNISTRLPGSLSEGQRSTPHPRTTEVRPILHLERPPVRPRRVGKRRPACVASGSLPGHFRLSSKSKNSAPEGQVTSWEPATRRFSRQHQFSLNGSGHCGTTASGCGWAAVRDAPDSFRASCRIVGA